MIAVSNDILSYLKTLPLDTTTFFRNVTWQDYELLLKEITDEPHIRLSYDNGTLEAMTISRTHEEISRNISRLVGVLEDELRMPIQTYGSSTQKKEEQAKGTEPDDCFYIQNAHRVAGKTIDLAVDPPPDLAIEVDIHSPSLSKFPIYAGLGVPELWRYKDDEVKIYRLVDEDYEEISHSLAFPFVTADVITEFLHQCTNEGHTVAKWAFADWVKAHKPTA